MGLKAGIVGLPNVGKSTLFNAITAANVEAANYPFATISPNTGVVKVPDQRVDWLSALFEPRKTIYATFEFNDIAGLVRGASKGEGLGNQFLAYIRECDAIIEVVRCFESAEIIHVENSVDPLRDIAIINLELVISDLDTLSKRKGKVEAKAKVSHDKDAIKELALIELLEQQLLSEKPVRLLATLSSEQREFINKNYFLLTNKPIIYAANVADSDLGRPIDNLHFQKVSALAKSEGAACIAISAAIEAELSQLPEEEKVVFLQDLNVTETGLDRLVRATYDLLNLATFFTVGKDEVRAWTFTNNMSAPECAGVIHSDFQKGFIKAEIYTYNDLRKYGSELAVKEAGKLRVEGRDYLMKDGDIVFFRFNV